MTPATDLISRKKPSHGMDFNFLRKKGIESIQELAGEVWTDHNSHDPGITILEHLCYAITELAYRSNFSIPDILADGPKKDSSLFSAREILTCNPVTELDFRKRIIDIQGVKNFWIEPTTQSEVDFYPNRAEGSLSYEPQTDGQSPVQLNGLYKALIEFEKHEKWGDLNDNTIAETFEFNEGPLEGFSIDISGTFARWNDKSINWNSYEEIGKSLSTLDIYADQNHDHFTITIRTEPVEGELPFAISVEIIDNSTTQGRKKVTLAKEVQSQIEQFVFSGKEPSESSLVGKYKEKILHILQILDHVKLRLHADRNLCEDFTTIEPMKVEDVLLCAEIELKPGVSTSEVLAKIYLEVGNFISPSPKFETLQSLRSGGAYTDELFEGPKLDNGFLQEKVLKNAERREILHVSDLINIMMDIEGVEAVKNVQIAGLILDEDQKEVPGKIEPWCLSLSHKKNFIPRLNLERSSISFTRDGLPLVVQKEEAMTRYEGLQLEQNEETDDSQLDLPVPQGESFQLADYYSIQREFPMTYGIGEAGLADSEPELRKAQARQLKGYLSIMEQLLAHSFSQVANVSELFALTESQRTYFSQPLYDVPRAFELMKPFLEKNGFNSESLLESIELIQEKWEELVEEKGNYLEKNLQGLTDQATGGETGNKKRRNRFLDHLMARFGEQYHEYSALINRTQDEASLQDLIHDKVSILKNYPEISHDRGKGFNHYVKNDIWDTGNVTGLEKRIMRLLGIEEVERRFLGNYFEVYLDNKNEYRWRIRREEDEEIILNSEEGYGSRVEIDAVLEQVMEFGKYREFYQPKETTNKKNIKYFFNLLNTSGEIIGISRQLFKKEEDRDDEIEMVIEFLNEKEDEEGLHVVEHLLLRPRIAGKDDLLPVDLKQCAEDDKVATDCPCDTDPYSFRISVYLPSWPQRFRNMDFRHYVESKIRMETPAHIFPKICWLNKTQMKEFEKNYRDWLHARAAFSFEPSEVFESNNFDGATNEIEGDLQSMKEKLQLNKVLPPDPKHFRDFLDRLFKQSKKKSESESQILEELNTISKKLEKLEIMIDYFEKHNSLIHSMRSLRNVYPYATLTDCKEGDAETPVSLDNTILGSLGTGPDAVRVAYPKRRDITDEGVGNLMIGKDFKIYTMEQRAKEGLERMKIGKNFKVK